MSDEKRRETLVEEVAEAEQVIGELERFSEDELEAMNSRLQWLQNQAISLGLSTRRIDQLKLKVASAIGPHGPAPGPGGQFEASPPPGSPAARDAEAEALAHAAAPDEADKPTQPQPPKQSKSPSDRKRAINDLFGE